MATPLYTIGHSTHPVDAFLAMLRRYAIATLVDIRTIPGSRRNPQFGQASLRESLKEGGIGYLHMKSLGGLRRPDKDSSNRGWRNEAFRGYADHMQTEEFTRGIDELIVIAARGPTAIMCAEAVPWRCHRSLVADALLVRGIEVVDILSADHSQTHALTSFARVDGSSVTYPAEG
jgi:uncharacterized protein (DUF488 family)